MSATLPPGEPFGPYRILEPIGRGGMAEVYRARAADGRLVALKVVRGSVGSQAVDAGRFLLEAQAASRIQHPNVASLLDAGQQGTVAWIALELVSGGSLEDRLRREGRIPWREAARLGAMIARGLAAVHAAGLVHRDVKPANVLLAERGVARLADFGLARVEGAAGQGLTHTGEIVGTLEFLAPEQAEPGRPIDARTDLYALGATLFALLTGEPPFRGTGLALVRSHLSEAPRSPRDLAQDVPEGLGRLVVRLLSKSPDARGESADAVARELEALAEGDGARGQGARRARGAVTLVAGALVVAAVATGASFASRSPRVSPTPAPPPAKSPEPAVAPWSAAVSGDGDTWKRVFALGDAASSEPRLLWEEPGRVAAPLRGVEGSLEALAAAFDGATSREGSRVRVRYARDAIGTEVHVPSSFFAFGDPRALELESNAEDPDPSAFLAWTPNDSGPIAHPIGHARWDEAAVSVEAGLRQIVDMDTFSIGLGDRALTLDGRTRLAHLSFSTTELARQTPFAFRADRGTTVLLHPGAPAGHRVVVDGRSRDGLEGVVARGVRGAEPTLSVHEALVAVRQLQVSGSPVRADVPARATVPAAIGTKARVAVAFERLGGPRWGGVFVALGQPGRDELRLEVEEGRCTLRRDGSLLAAEALPPGDVPRGWLLLERREDRIDGAYALGDAPPRLLHAVSPEPLAGLEPRGSYGSTAASYRFRHAEVRVGPEDPVWKELERQRGSGTPLGELGTPAAEPGAHPRAAFWTAASRSTALLVPRFADPSLFGPDRRVVADPRDREPSRRAERARRAVVVGEELERGATRLDPAAQAEALSRATFLAVVAGDPESALRRATQLVALVGRARAAEIVDALECVHDEPKLLDRLSRGYAGLPGAPGSEAAVHSERGYEAALAVAEVLSPGRASTLLARATLLRTRYSRSPPPAPIELLQQAHLLVVQAEAAGAPTMDLDGEALELAERAGQSQIALENLDRLLERVPSSFGYWSRRALVLERLGRGREALESAVGGVAWNLRNFPFLGGSAERHLAAGGDRGFLAACSAATRWLGPPGSADGIGDFTRRLAREVDPARAPDREVALAAYARNVVGDTDVPAPPMAGGDPVWSLLRARLSLAKGDLEGARAALDEAVDADPLVRHLARLDPDLFEVTTR